MTNLQTMTINFTPKQWALVVRALFTLPNPDAQQLASEIWHNPKSDDAGDKECILRALHTNLNELFTYWADHEEHGRLADYDEAILTAVHSAIDSL